MNMQKTFFCLGLAGCSFATLQAHAAEAPQAASSTVTRVSSIRVAQAFADHMILQRNHAIPVWGTAKPGAEITIRFGNQTRQTRAGSDGVWNVHLDAMPACDKPQDLTLTEENGASRVITDVLVGDVWLGSGQSNMAWSMDMVAKTTDFRAEALEQVQKDIAGAANPLIRLYSGKWEVCSPTSVLTTSAVGYYFSLEVQRNQHIPVGFIKAAIGGSRIEPWISAGDFAACDALKEESAQWEAVKNPGERVGFLYDRVVAPWTRFPIRGILWYQGESNVAKGDTPLGYATKMALLIQSWRRAWGLETLPFYWVQLSPVAYTRGADPGRLPAFQEVQRRMLSLPHTGMAMTADVDDGRPGDLHPRNKWDVGRRLWRVAAWNVYGKKEMVPCGPLYKGLKTEGKNAVISFEHAGTGLVAHGGERLWGFELRDETGPWVAAEATIRGTEVVLQHADISKPAAARYNWHESAKRSLYNREGLPASPFCSEETLPVRSERPPGDSPPLQGR